MRFEKIKKVAYSIGGKWRSREPSEKNRYSECCWSPVTKIENCWYCYECKSPCQAYKENF